MCQAVTNGFKCNKGTVTIGATDPSITQHAWMVDGVIVETTDAQFQKTFNKAGFHNINHAGANSCGACAQNTQLEIVAPKGVSLLAIGTVLTLGILGIVILKKK